VGGGSGSGNNGGGNNGGAGMGGGNGNGLYVGGGMGGNNGGGNNGGMGGGNNGGSLYLGGGGSSSGGSSSGGGSYGESAARPGCILDVLQCFLSSIGRFIHCPLISDCVSHPVGRFGFCLTWCAPAAVVCVMLQALTVLPAPLATQVRLMQVASQNQQHSLRMYAFCGKQALSLESPFSSTSN
jgi:hypothetical protein